MDGFRLSPQQSLLDHAALGSERDQLWSQQLLLEISGDDLDESDLRQALEAVIASHEIFSTYFTTLSGIRVQAISERGSRDYWTTFDMRQKSVETQADEILEARRSQRSSIPTEDDCPIQATWFQLSDRNSQLLISASPMIADGTTLIAVANEMFSHLQADSDGAKRDEEALEYADISEWLNEILESDDSASERHEWERTLEIESSPPVAATSVSESTRFSFRKVSLKIEPTVRDAIEHLAAEADVPVSTVLQASWFALLARLGEGGRIVCGRVSDGRTYDELANEFGPLSKSLPLVAQLSDDQNLKGYVKQVHEQLLGSDARQEHFEVFNQSNSYPSTKYWNRLCEVIELSLHTTGPSCEATIRDIAAHDSPFRQKLTLSISDGQITAALWFDEALASSIESQDLLERWYAFLERALSEQSSSLTKVSLLIDNDLAAIQKNDRRSDLVVDRNNDIFAVLRNLDKWDATAPAVSAGDSTWTYGELSEWSNKVANRLLKNDSKGDAPIGICIPRRPELIAAIIGVLNAGKTYIPIDPSYPPARIADVLNDSGASILLTTEEVQLDLSLESCEEVQVQRGGSDLANSSNSLPSIETSDEAIAYILYTSGSTGKPKGVAVSRSNLSHSTAARLSFYDETPSAFLLLSSIAFDSSVAGLFWTLLGGGHLLLPETTRGLDAKEIAKICESHKPTHTLCLPSVYRLLLDELADSDLHSLTCVIVAGESCASSVVSEHFSRAPSRQLVNEYGPTEGTVWSVAHEFSDSEDLSNGVPIGRAVPGYLVRVLDDNQQPVPVGCKGEIYISGDGIAAGYWKQDELTAERFLTLGDTSEESFRTYRTGDIARLRSSGEIEFFGRRDNQVKVNGYRIELEEIESAIKVLPGIVDAAVVLRDDDHSQQRIVAFVNLEEGFVVDDVSSQLGERLPAYMLPSTVQDPGDLPRTPNGKIDRSALVDMPLENNEIADYVAPRSEIEQLIVDVWCELLQREEIGVEDDFFRIGGHSILATRLAARLREYLRVPVPIRLIFENPTVAGLTAALREDPASASQIEQVEKALTSN